MRAGEHESVYANMPRSGLAVAGRHVAVGSGAQSAAKRLGVRPDDEPPVAPY